MDSRDFLKGLATTGSLSLTVFGLLPDDPSSLEWDANDLKAVVEQEWLCDDRLGTPIDDLLRSELALIKARTEAVVAAFNKHDYHRVVADEDITVTAVALGITQ